MDAIVAWRYGKGNLSLMVYWAPREVTRVAPKIERTTVRLPDRFVGEHPLIQEAALKVAADEWLHGLQLYTGIVPGSELDRLDREFPWHQQHDEPERVLRQAIESAEEWVRYDAQEEAYSEHYRRFPDAPGAEDWAADLYDAACEIYIGDCAPHVTGGHDSCRGDADCYHGWCDHCANEAVAKRRAEGWTGRLVVKFGYSPVTCRLWLPGESEPWSEWVERDDSDYPEVDDEPEADDQPEAEDEDNTGN